VEKKRSHNKTEVDKISISLSPNSLSSPAHLVALQEGGRGKKKKKGASLARGEGKKGKGKKRRVGTARLTLY